MASGECLNLSEPAASSAKASQGSALRTKLDHADEWLIADRERCGPRHLPEGPAASCCSVATGRTPAPSEELGCRDPPLHPRLCPQGQLASRGRHPGGCAGPMWDPWKTDCLSSLLGWLRPHGVWWGGVSPFSHSLCPILLPPLPSAGADHNRHSAFQLRSSFQNRSCSRAVPCVMPGTRRGFLESPINPVTSASPSPPSPSPCPPQPKHQVGKQVQNWVEMKSQRPRQVKGSKSR